MDHRYHCRRRQSEYRYYFGVRLSVGASPDDSYIGDNPANYQNWTPPAETWTYPEINGYLKEALEFSTKKCKDKNCTGAIKNTTDFGVSADSSIGRYIFVSQLVPYRTFSFKI